MSTNTTAHVAEISVLIVGAGPTGLTLTCELARRGVDEYMGFIGSDKSIDAIDAYLERTHGREWTARRDVRFRSSPA